MDGPQPEMTMKPQDFLPPPGSISDHVELQLALLTQGLTECMLRAGMPEGEPDAPPEWRGPGLRRAAVMAAPKSTPRENELRDATRIATASARLVGALARMRGEFRHHYTVSHVQTTEDTARHRRTTTIVTGVFAAGRHETECDGRQDMADAPSPAGSDGSNASP